MRYLYIDDERTPKTDLPWDIARSFEDATNFIRENDVPDYISFDHDLGTALSGFDIAKWLVEQDLDGTINIPKNFQYNVHSANPVGAKNIQCLLDSYMNYKNDIWG